MKTVLSQLTDIPNSKLIQTEYNKNKSISVFFTTMQKEK